MRSGDSSAAASEQTRRERTVVRLESLFFSWFYDTSVGLLSQQEPHEATPTCVPSPGPGISVVPASGSGWTFIVFTAK